MIPYTIASIRRAGAITGCLGLLALFFADAARPAHAFFKTYNEAWCANLGDGLEDCSYYTWRQCRAAASGTGNFCFPNPRYIPPPEPPRVKRKYDRG